jgi:hypothetical protein
MSEINETLNTKSIMTDLKVQNNKNLDLIFENKHNRISQDLRKEILSNHKKEFPEITDYYENSYKYRFDFRNEFNNSILRDYTMHYSQINKSVADFRNNIGAYNKQSTTINMTDSRFSNEARTYVKTLVNKGIPPREVFNEVEKIYGLGIISTNEFYRRNVKFSNYFLLFWGKTVFFGTPIYILFKLIKKLVK